MATRPPKLNPAKSKAAAPASPPAKKSAAKKAAPAKSAFVAKTSKPKPRRMSDAEHLEASIAHYRIPTLVVGERGRITLPAGVREQLGIEAGSLMIVVPHGEGFLELIPATAVPRDQLRYYSQEILEAMEAARLESERGETYVTNSPEELQALLDSWKTESPEE